MLFEEGVDITTKDRGNKGYANSADEITDELVRAVLCFDAPDPLYKLLGEVGLGNQEVIEGFDNLMSMDVDDRVEFLKEVQKKVKSAIQRFYVNHICPVVFFIGSTGQVPDEYRAKPLTKEEAQKEYPGLKFGKKEEEAMFFSLGKHTILSVYSETSYFSR